MQLQQTFSFLENRTERITSMRIADCLHNRGLYSCRSRKGIAASSYGNCWGRMRRENNRRLGMKRAIMRCYLRSPCELLVLSWYCFSFGDGADFVCRYRRLCRMGGRAWCGTQFKNNYRCDLGSGSCFSKT